MTSISTALADAHARWHADNPTDGDPIAVAAHHAITSEIVSNGGSAVQCATDAIVELSRVRNVSADPQNYAEIPLDLVAALRQAWDAGVTLVDVCEILGQGGYELRVVPADAPAGFGALVGTPDSDQTVAEQVAERISDTLNMTKGMTFEAENKIVARNKRRAAAQEPHTFTAARWATRDGRTRCLTCGGPAPMNESCSGLSYSKAERATARKEGPTMNEVHVDAIMGPSRRKKPLKPLVDKDYLEPEQPEEPEEPEELALTPRQQVMAEAYEIIVESFGAFNQGSGPDGSHYMPDNPFAASGIACGNCVFYENGMCEIVDGEIKPEAVCKLWVINADLISTEEAAKAHGPHSFVKPETGMNCATCGQGSDNWRHAAVSKATRGLSGSVNKADAARRYTLGPMYIPDTVDAHGEWTDSESLQDAVWEYVRSGDRRIRLQHNRDVVAGEWVECLTWPFEVQVPQMTIADDGTETTTTVTFPAGTVFLGVVWEPWAWQLVLARRLNGFSIGGKAERILADLPDQATA